MPASCSRAIPSSIRPSQRHGNMLTVLEEYAGLPVAKLTKIQRQKGDYARAVRRSATATWTKAMPSCDKLGWMVEGEGHDALVAEYAKPSRNEKPTASERTVLVIDPTHKDGDALTEKLRAVRKDKGLIVGEEKAFSQLTALGWTHAQKGDAGTVCRR